ncbi:MAG: hypothetical protein WBM32_13420 [Crocosphaera sp.]
MSEILVNQGRYIKTAEPPCGSNGLGTCVGVAILHNSHWFIAHIDSEAIVKNKTKDPMFQKVSNYVKSRLDHLLGTCNLSNDVHIIGGLNDFSAQAIDQGIVAWVNSTVQIHKHNWDGFKIVNGNQFEKLRHEANNCDGDGDFSVPKDPT